MVNKRNLYVPVKIPKTLADEMDSLIGHFGYKTRAEIAKDGIRMVLRQFMNANPAKEA